MQLENMIICQFANYLIPILNHYYISILKSRISHIT
jgi:hypothetical protein